LVAAEIVGTEEVIEGGPDEEGVEFLREWIVGCG